MTTPKLPAIDPATVAEHRGSGYPEPFRSRDGRPRQARLGDACGLTRFGVNLVTLGPGGQSALRHWHTLEDEFVYVLSGEVVLVTDGGEQVLTRRDVRGLSRRQARTRITSSIAAARRRPTSRSATGPTATTRSIRTTTSCGARTRRASYAAHKDGRRY